MDLALKAAENAGKSGEVPIGCVIVRNNEVIATAGNRTLTDRDPTAHAEILAIRQAAAAVGSERLVDCDLYVTLEPCTMCAGAISLARIRRLYYGAADPKGGAVDSGVRFFASADLPSRAGSLFGGRRERSGDVAAGVFQGEEVVAQRREHAPSSSAKADDPVFRALDERRGVLDTRLRGYDGFA